MTHKNEQDELVFLDQLQKGSKELGIHFSDPCLTRFLRHREILVKWGSKMNLTTVFEPRQMAELLYLDSAVMGLYLDQKSEVQDVGTGPGFPGLVLKSMWMESQVTLTEAREKKVSFLKSAARHMQIQGGLKICLDRITESHKGLLGEWQEVVSRATFPPDLWLLIGSKLVRPGGRLWLFGEPPSVELFGFYFEKKHEYYLSVTKKKRTLCSFRKNR